MSKEYTIEEIRELMRLEGIDPDNWVQFCAFINRNFTMELG